MKNVCLRAGIYLWTHKVIYSFSDTFGLIMNYTMPSAVAFCPPIIIDNETYNNIKYIQ